MQKNPNGNIAAQPRSGSLTQVPLVLFKKCQLQDYLRTLYVEQATLKFQIPPAKWNIYRIFIVITFVKLA